jgi:large subunit ribosomal protein L24
MHVRKGDQVVVIAGKEKGKRGRVLRLLTGAGRVVIERINMVKRHTKPSQRNPRGGIVEKEGSVESSNVSLWCGKCVAPRRAKVQEGSGKESKGTEGHAQKRRVCIKCGTVFETS